MKLLIAYKNGTSDEFSEDQIDCSKQTIRGKADSLITEWKNSVKEVYLLDNYNAINLSEVISVRVMLK